MRVLFYIAAAQSDIRATPHDKLVGVVIAIGLRLRHRKDGAAGERKFTGGLPLATGRSGRHPTGRRRWNSTTPKGTEVERATAGGLIAARVTARSQKGSVNRGRSRGR